MGKKEEGGQPRDHSAQEITAEGAASFQDDDDITNEDENLPEWFECMGESLTRLYGEYAPVETKILVGILEGIKLGHITKGCPEYLTLAIAMGKAAPIVYDHMDLSDLAAFGLFGTEQLADIDKRMGKFVGIAGRSNTR